MRAVHISSVLVKRFLVLGTLIITVASGFFCNPPSEKEGTSRWRNVYDTTAHYVGMQQCRQCHEGVYETFIKTGMGQSFDHAMRTKSAADFSPAHALVYDSVLDYYYKPFWQSDSLYIMEFRLAGKDTIHKRIQRIDYIVGSGQHTNSHLFSVDGYLYQAPITFYTQKQRWDLAPGFEKGANSRFGRMIEAECITCHDGYPVFDTNSENKFTTLKTGIDCERCHGPGSIHVQEKMAGKVVDTSKGPDYSIVNPRRLPTELQNNVCQRCHLQGIATLNDGKTFFDFRPGMKLSEVVNVFMPSYEGPQDKMIMASHVERMKKSRCYIESGKMSCITCHNPHIGVKYTERQVFLNACLSCHNTKNACSEAIERRNAQRNDCIICHMPRNSSIDIPHVAVTDHYIRRNPQADTAQKKITAFLGMNCVNNTNPSAITRARGFLEFYERYAQSPGLLDSALFYLDQDKTNEQTAEQNRDYIRVWFWQAKYALVTAQADQTDPNSINDAWTTYRIGESFYKQLQPEKALPWYRRTVAIKKFALDFQNKYATCLLSVGGIDDAAQVFQFILSQNPDYVTANANYGYILMQRGKDEEAYRYLDRARHLDPDHEVNLINLAVWYHKQGKLHEAHDALAHLLAKHPENHQAHVMIDDLDKNLK